MAKKDRRTRATPAEYIPYGKPEEVLIERVEAEKGPDGTWIEARYVERLAGVRSENLGTSRSRLGGLHSPSCQGRPGISRIYWRGGEAWCTSCYRVRWGIHPLVDPNREDKPRRPRS